MKINEIDPGQKQKFEPSNTDYEFSYDKFLLDCSESIAAMKGAGKFLYRGVKSKSPDIYLGKSRDSRKPKDTTNQIDAEMNSIMAKAGFKAIRNNSIFCSGSSIETNMYGTKFLIFPKNGCDITWSSEVDDLTRFLALNASKLKRASLYTFSDVYKKYMNLGFNVTSYLRKLPEEYRGFEYDSKIPGPEKTALKKINHAIYSSESFFKIDPTTGGYFFPTVIDAKKVLIAIEQYNQRFNKDIGAKLFPLLGGMVPFLTEYIKYAQIVSNPQKNITASDIMEGMGYVSGNLEAGLKSRHEIMVHGEYYAFNDDKYYYSLKEALLT